MATTDTDGATCRSRRALTQTAEVGLVRPPPRGDLPHRLHRRVTDGVDAVVEVDRRIAVRRKELDALAETRRAHRGLSAALRSDDQPLRPRLRQIGRAHV